MVAGRKALSKNILVPLSILFIFAVVAAVGCTDPGTKSDPSLEAKLIPGRAKPAGTGPNILLLINDAWRKDSVGIYNPKSSLTPRIDAFAKTATVFETAVAQSSYTINSSGSMLFGVYPSEHHYTSYKKKISDNLLSVAELLKIAGYTTYGVSTNPHVTKRNGFDQGFDQFQDSSTWIKLSCGKLNEMLISWLSERKKNQAQELKPYFAMIWYTDTHNPYDPPEEFKQKYVHAQNRKLISDRTMSPMLKMDPPITSAEEPVSKQLYDAAVNYFDTEFGALLDHLKREKMLENTVIILTSDHGEAFWENKNANGKRLVGHGSSLYSEQVDVPLIIYLPRQKTGERVSSPAEHIDLFPTLAKLAGFSPPWNEIYKGKDFFSKTDDHRKSFIFTELFIHQGKHIELRGVRDSHEGLVFSKIVEDKVYKPPHEKVVKYGTLVNSDESSQSVRVSMNELKSAFDQWDSKLNKTDFPAGRIKKLDKKSKTELEEKLQALGYLQ